MSSVERVSGIPIIDFSSMSIEHKVRPDSNSEAVQSLSKQIYEAFSTTGFVYLKNHGVQQHYVSSNLTSLSSLNNFLVQHHQA